MNRKSTNLREYRRQTERRLLLGIVLLLLLVGGGLIGWLYGPPAIVSALLCLVPGAGVLLLLWLIFYLIERFTQEK